MALKLPPPARRVCRCEVLTAERCLALLAVVRAHRGFGEFLSDKDFERYKLLAHEVTEGFKVCRRRPTRNRAARRRDALRRLLAPVRTGPPNFCASVHTVRAPNRDVRTS